MTTGLPDAAIRKCYNRSSTKLRNESVIEEKLSAVRDGPALFGNQVYRCVA